MKKSKGQTVDLLYTNKKEVNKKTKNVGVSSARTKKGKKRNSNKKNTKKTQNKTNEIINLDNEIIIGLTPKKVEKDKPKRKTKKTSKSNNKKTTSKNIDRAKDYHQRNKKANLSKPKQNKSKKKSQKNRKNTRIIKWIILILLLLTAIVLFMRSSVFNIRQIIVTNNSKISSEEIINLSTLTPGVNMFKTTNGIIRKNIKANPYIENVKVKRNLNGTITLEVEERTPTYMLKFANAYVYINNQGYILELSENPLKLPIITGFQTPEETINAGNRLAVDDLKKLADVIKIMESARSISLADIITEIDITDEKNYKLTIASEGKTVQFGDCSSINIKLLKVQALIEKEKGVQGEIYFHDLDKTVFREKV